MKGLPILVPAIFLSASAFAQEAAVYSGNYSASVAAALARSDADHAWSRFGLSTSASAQSMSHSRTDTDGERFGNYSANVTADAFHR
jgi:hypothetical protein